MSVTDTSATVATAFANAIFGAIGVRLREVPLNPQRVLGALRGEPGLGARS